MRTAATVGVLAFQGAFSKHISMLHSLKVAARLVRTHDDLKKCDALILPGGESTTISRHIDNGNMREPLQEFAAVKPVFGTCAGAILLAREVIQGSVKSLRVLDVCVARNAFGRQKDSFSTSIDISLNQSSRPFRGIFIRAPRITDFGQGVKILATFNEEPVLIQQNRCLASTFHPELTNDPFIHKFFLKFLG